MYYYVILLLVVFLLVIIYLYKTSENKWFYQSKEDLELGKIKMIQVLKGYGRSPRYIRLAIVSYHYFSTRPHKFDGTTIARDLFDVTHNNHRLAVASLIHDFIWIRFRANVKLFLNLWSNWKYFKDLIKNGKPPMYFRLIGLMLIAIPFVVITILKNRIRK